MVVGRRRRKTYELHTDLPASARWPGKLLCIQRYVPSDLFRGIESGEEEEEENRKKCDRNEIHEARPSFRFNYRGRFDGGCK